MERQSFSHPQEVREFPNARADIVNIGGGQVSRTVLQPGWRWSTHVKPVAQTEWCEAPHFMYAVCGTVHIVMRDGREFDIHAGDVAVLEPGHDAWVVGDEPAIGVDWGGAHAWGKPA